MTSQGLGGLLFPILLLVFFYFFLIVPEQKKQKKAKQLVESLVLGTSIVTRGGIYGKIVDINGDVIVITTGPDQVKISLSRFSVSSVVKTDEPVKTDIEESYSENGIPSELNDNEINAESNVNEEKNE